MKKLLFLFFVLGLTLSACRTSQTQSAPPAQTSTPSLVPTATQTPIPPTATVTPLPTIPTFTPTFDASTIVTVTPVREDQCPMMDQALELDLRFKEIDACIKSANENGKDSFDCLNKNLPNDILDYLNAGGDINKVIFQLNEEYENYDKDYYFNYINLTGDVIPELLLRNPSSMIPAAGFYIFTCISGQYSIEYDSHQDDWVSIFSIQDINLNGIPDVIFLYLNVLVVVEWDGDSFIETLGIRDFGESRYQIQDLNKDGLSEIMLSRGYPPAGFEANELPWRYYTSIFAWNGSSYVLKSKEFEYPKYRFQAIQDADKFASNGMNEKALSYYQDAIFNKDLGWWSPERREFLLAYLHSLNTPIPSALDPTPDPTEYPRLAAYAYYRIMLLHLAQGQDAEAASTYQTLQETFGNDPYAAPYVEMASAFWEAYQSTNKMYDGCAAAIQYAVEHPEILVPLGSDYHGWQSHIYEPADVCPFR